MEWVVYLSGEIHSDWRERIESGARQLELPIEFVAHANTKTNMERMPAFQSANGKQFLPSRTYTDRLSLLNGDDQIDLYYFGQAHTSGDTIVVFPALGVAHTGDMFAWKGVPYIDVNNGGSGVSYPNTLLTAADTIPGVDTVIPGHSPVMTWADFREFGEFNRDFLAAVQRGKAEGKTAAQAAASLNLPAKYANYAMSRGTLTSAEDNAAKIYAELDRLEPVEKDHEVFRPISELYPWPLGTALVVGVLLILLPQLPARRHR